MTSFSWLRWLAPNSLPAELSAREQRWQISNGAHPWGPVPAEQLSLKCCRIDSSRYYRAGGSDRQSCTGTATPAAEVQACVGRQLSSSLTLSAHTLVGETRASLTLYTLNTRSLWFEALGCSSFLRRRSLTIWKANRPTLELVKSHTHTQTLRFCCVSLNLNALKQNVAQERDLFSRKTDRGREREKKREK